MSRYIEVNPETGKNEIWLDDPKKCKHMYNKMCCEGKSKYVTECPNTEQCRFCRHFAKENLKVGQMIRSTLLGNERI